MKIYMVERTDQVGYDEYDSFVCVAHDETQARWMVPDPEYHMWKEIDGKPIMCYSYREQKPATFHSWTDDINSLKVNEIIPSDPKVILASYNAG
jgi:hypothetical protein